MSRELEFNIRPKIRIGRGRQTTFLAGSVEDVCQSYRRAMGIRWQDDLKLVGQLTEDFYFKQKKRGINIPQPTIILGADLTEWEIRAEGSAMMSANKVKAWGIKV